MQDEYFEIWGTEWRIRSTGYGDFILILRPKDGWRYQFHVDGSTFGQMIYDVLQRRKNNYSPTPGEPSEMVVFSQAIASIGEKTE